MRIRKPGPSAGHAHGSQDSVSFVGRTRHSLPPPVPSFDSVDNDGGEAYLSLSPGRTRAAVRKMLNRRCKEGRGVTQQDLSLLAGNGEASPGHALSKEAGRRQLRRAESLVGEGVDDGAVVLTWGGRHRRPRSGGTPHRPL